MGDLVIDEAPLGVRGILPAHMARVRLRRPTGPVGPVSETSVTHGDS